MLRPGSYARVKPAAFAAPLKPVPMAPPPRSMGCLPVPLFFLLGFGIGYAVDGATGALWGAGIGLVIGLAGMGWMIRLMRGRR